MAPEISKEEKLWQTVAYGLRHRLDARFEERIPLDRFKGEMKEAIDGENIPPLDDKVLGYLYERALDAKVDIEAVRILNRIRRGTTWKAHQAGIARMRDALKTIPKFAEVIDPRFLAEEVNHQVKQAVDLSSRLDSTLAEIQRWNARMEEMSKWRNQNAVLRSARLRMARTLKEHCPNLTQLQRAAVIQYAVERAELKESETAEAIMRLTRRHGSKTAKTTKP